MSLIVCEEMSLTIGGGVILDQNCSKCKSAMVKSLLDSHPIRVYRADVKPNAKTMSHISPCYVCPNCGFIEFYAEEPEKFKL